MNSPLFGSCLVTRKELESAERDRFWDMLKQTKRIKSRNRNTERCDMHGCTNKAAAYLRIKDRVLFLCRKHSRKDEPK